MHPGVKVPKAPGLLLLSVCASLEELEGGGDLGLMR